MAVDAAEGFEAPEMTDRYSSVEDWVSNYLSPVVQRKSRPGVVWCAKWWQHPEAANRLWALWRAWEAFRSQGGSGMSSWWLYHFDPTWGELTSDQGPFTECRSRRGRGQGHRDTDRPLPHVPAPEGWWTVVLGDLGGPLLATALNVDQDQEGEQDHDEDERSLR